jgi:hypothetical protein
MTKLALHAEVLETLSCELAKALGIVGELTLQPGSEKYQHRPKTVRTFSKVKTCEATWHVAMSTAVVKSKLKTHPCDGKNNVEADEPDAKLNNVN